MPARRDLLFPLLLLGGLALSRAGAQALGLLLPQDRGPRELDVSAYPPEIREGYRVFAHKCSKCHTLARPLNTTMRADFWARYVGEMMQRPASNIGETDARAIYAFLAYDQTHRKDADPGRFFPPLTEEQIELLLAERGRR